MEFGLNAFIGIFVDSGVMWARTLHWFLGLKILPPGLGFKVGQNAPFYTTFLCKF